MKLSDIRGKSMAEISSSSAAEQREMWGYMRRVLKSRFKTFEKHGLGEAIPRRFREGVATVRQLEKKGSLAREISMALGYLEGKTATCYPGYEEHLKGATLAADGVRVVTDGKVITAAGMGVALEFGLALVAALKDMATAERIRREVLAD